MAARPWDAMLPWSSLLLLLFVQRLSAFVPLYVSIVPTTRIKVPNSSLNAKRGRAKQKRKQIQRRQRNVNINEGDNGNDNGSKLHKQLKTRAISLPVGSQQHPHQQPQQQVTIYEICHDDQDWWDPTKNDNPYGARVWPSSLYMAQYVVSNQNDTATVNLKDHRILELACGTGLFSIAAAAAGATVVATDICPTCLALTRAGWQQTQKQQRQQQNQETYNTTMSGGCGSGSGSLTTQIFDICGNDPLPKILNKDPTLIVAGAVLYDVNLAEALARSILTKTTCRVMIGEDDTGFRQNGRARFLQLLEKHCSADQKRVLTWTPSTAISCPQLGWKSKQVQIMHYSNTPDSCSSATRDTT